MSVLAVLVLVKVYAVVPIPVIALSTKIVLAAIAITVVPAETTEVAVFGAVTISPSAIPVVTIPLIEASTASLIVPLTVAIPVLVVVVSVVVVEVALINAVSPP